MDDIERLIKLFEKQRRMLEGQLPHSGAAGQAADWPSDLPLPADFVPFRSSDDLIERLERGRQEAVQILKDGVGTLLEKEAHLRSELEARHEEWETRCGRAEKLLNLVYPDEDGIDRRLSHAAVNSTGTLAIDPDTEEERELLSVSDQQGAAQRKMQTLALDLWIVQAALYRHRRAIRNDREGWEPLYEMFPGLG